MCWFCGDALGVVAGFVHAAALCEKMHGGILSFRTQHISVVLQAADTFVLGAGV
jgi:hypothetical protein